MPNDVPDMNHKCPYGFRWLLALLAVLFTLADPYHATVLNGMQHVED